MIFFLHKSLNKFAEYVLPLVFKSTLPLLKESVGSHFLWKIATLNLPKNNGNTQESVGLSRHDWKLLTWPLTLKKDPQKPVKAIEPIDMTIFYCKFIISYKCSDVIKVRLASIFFNHLQSPLYWLFSKGHVGEYCNLQNSADWLKYRF